MVGKEGKEYLLHFFFFPVATLGKFLRNQIGKGKEGVG